MPRKIGFNVVSSSSHEENFSAKQLMVHAPTVSGWRSSRHCSYPQHITLQLVERSRVKKLQLLAHHYLISTQVEFHIGDTLPEPSTPAFIGQLRRLGYVSLSDNEKTGFRARELKSVHVDAVGTYLKITLHQNHANRHNHYNQVSLVAINVLGDPLDGSNFYTMPSRVQLIEHYLNSTQLEAASDATLLGKCDAMSPLDDLAFNMYQDPEVAQIIRQLDQKKQDMARQERYEQAEYLRQAITDLQKAGEHLARFDIERQSATEKEDYDLAKKKKDEMDEYRKNLYQQLKDHDLLDMKMITNAAQSQLFQEVPSPVRFPDCRSLPTKAFGRGKAFSRTSESRRSDSDTVASEQSNPPTPCASSSSATLPKIDMLLPAPQPVMAIQSPMMDDTQSTVLSPEMGEEPEALSENAKRDAGLSIDVFGEKVVAGAYSKKWLNRKDALVNVQKKLLEISSKTPKEELRATIRAAVFLVKRALQDKVLFVFQASLKLLFFIFSQQIPGLGRAEMTYGLEKTWPVLLARTGDSPNRLRVDATTCIQEIAVLKAVRALEFIPAELVKPFKSNFPSRLAQSRVEMVASLLVQLGMEHSGFTLANVMKFCTAALEHNNPAVREQAVHIILSLYRQHSTLILNYLPSNTAAGKNFVYKTLFDSFGKIDEELAGTQPLKKIGGTQDGKTEEEEIQSLQERLAALKEMTERDSRSTKQTAKKEVPKVERESQKAGKPTVAKLPQNKTKHDVQLSMNYLDNLCIFCGKTDDSFTQDGLDLHYWKHCPMLRRCDECRQVVEITSFTEHLLNECESRSKFSQCQHCSEAVAVEDLTRHVQGPTCNPPISGQSFSHCPLCHNNFPPGEEVWKAHLTGREGCKQNSRRTAVSQRTQPVQGKALPSTKITQTWSVGARGRPKPGRGCVIPSLEPVARGHTPGKRPRLGVLWTFWASRDLHGRWRDWWDSNLGLGWVCYGHFGHPGTCTAGGGTGGTRT
ncbi:centrosomal protein of 104 kDa isoform X4 [Nerophis ophidion]|nr:centrosomal protein of 104 kDa isoform X4 [Nerophis ophidion]XP_061760798.1 centrosomal protein of 104 kDa isoform X4 [Nerophis ophidion]